MLKMMLKSIINFIKEQLLPVVSVNDAEKMLKQAIIQGRPMMCARFGAVEIKSVLYVTLHYPFPFCLSNILLFI